MPNVARAQAVAVGLATLGCPNGPDREPEAIERWLLCDECRGGERDSLVALGEEAVSSLADHLRGPSAAARENMRRRIVESYVPGGALSQNDYISRMLENYEALTQKRAALGLGAIGTASARRELEHALDSADIRRYRSDVLRAVQRGLVQASFDAFTGSLSDTSVGFGDTVKTRRGTLAWDGDESVVLNGAPFPDDIVTTRWADSLAFVAVGDWGNYDVSVTRLGPQQVTQRAPLRIIAVDYEAHAPASALLVTAAPFPQTHYLALRTRLGDTTDHYRFVVPAALPVTARVESPGSRLPFVRWYECPPTAFATLGPASTLSGTVVNDQGAGVGGAMIRIIGTGTSAMTAPTGRFAISGISPSVTATGFVDLQVSRIGFQSRIVRVQVGADSVLIGLVAEIATERSARSRQASSVVLPAGSCRVLQVGVGSHGGVQIIRLRLTSP